MFNESGFKIIYKFNYAFIATKLLASAGIIEINSKWTLFTSFFANPVNYTTFIFKSFQDRWLPSGINLNSGLIKIFSLLIITPSSKD